MPPEPKAPTASPASPSHPPATGLTEIRYPLPELLAELELERNAGSFAMEKLHQAEIGKIFQTTRKRRVKK